MPTTKAHLTHPLEKRSATCLANADYGDEARFARRGE
jgi:hypothetical protein